MTLARFTLTPARWTPGLSFADTIPPRPCVACGQMIDRPESRTQKYHRSAGYPSQRNGSTPQNTPRLCIRQAMRFPMPNKPESLVGKTVWDRNGPRRVIGETRVSWLIASGDCTFIGATQEDVNRFIRMWEAGFYPYSIDKVKKKEWLPPHWFTVEADFDVHREREWALRSSDRISARIISGVYRGEISPTLLRQIAALFGYVEGK